MTEACNRHPSESAPFDPPHLEAVPPLSPLTDTFTRGIIAPRADIAPLSSAEFTAFRRRGSEHIGLHLVTTVLLRCAGEDDTMSDFEAFQAARAELGKLSEREYVEGWRLKAAAKALDIAAAQSQDYIDVLPRVQPFANRYAEMYAGTTSHHRALRDIAIYEPTEDFEHPGLDLIQAARGPLGDRAVPGERIFRMILLATDGPHKTERDIS